MYYIGIDGGGTKTIFTVIDSNGVKLNQITVGTTHYVQIGFDGLKKVLSENIQSILLENNIKKSELGAVFLGLPGYGEVKDAKEKIEKLVCEVLGDINYKIGNDVEVGLAGSLAGQNGINIVSGTGSIALGKNEKESIRCGGWGDFVGDEGSAYWIGKKVLEVFSKQSDGRIKKGDLYYNIKKSLDINEDFDIIDFAINKIAKDRSKIATLSILCSESVINGDEEAKKIFDDAGYELSLLVKTIIDKLKLNGEVLVSYSGGVFKSEKLILEPIKANLKDYKIRLVKPILSPSMGACLLAYKLKNNNIDDDFIQNLKK